MSLTVSSYVKQYYKGNIFGATQTDRELYSAQKLVQADMQAVKRALKDLHSYDYDSKDEDEDDNDELNRKVQAFVNTYNNFVDSAGDIGNDDLDRSLNALKKMTKKQGTLLADIGIKVQNNGRLKIDTEKLESASANKIRKVFSEDSDYGTQVEKQLKKVKNLIRLKNLDVPVQKSVKKPADPVPPQTDAADGNGDNAENAQLAQLVAASLEGSQINYTI